LSEVQTGKLPYNNLFIFQFGLKQAAMSACFSLFYFKTGKKMQIMVDKQA